MLAAGATMENWLAGDGASKPPGDFLMLLPVLVGGATMENGLTGDVTPLPISDVPLDELSLRMFAAGATMENW